LVAARRLSIWGAEVAVILGQARGDIRGAPLHQLTILDRMGVPVHGPGHASTSGPPPTTTLRTADLALDALLGYSLRGAPREPIAALIRAANAAAASSGPRILALDLPSGLDGDTGEASEPTVRAAATLTLALPKVGLLRPAAREWVGELYVADISVPELVYRRLGLRVGPIFGRADIVGVAPSG
jgi:NAD(P)H-hydrate epimerase